MRDKFILGRNILCLVTISLSPLRDVKHIYCFKALSLHLSAWYSPFFVLSLWYIIYNKGVDPFDVWAHRLKGIPRELSQKFLNKESRNCLALIYFLCWAKPFALFWTQTNIVQRGKTLPNVPAAHNSYNYQNQEYTANWKIEHWQRGIRAFLSLFIPLMPRLANTGRVISADPNWILDCFTFWVLVGI